MSAESTSGGGSDFRSLQSAGRCRTPQMEQISHSGRTWKPGGLMLNAAREAGKIQGVNLRRSSELHVSRRMGTSQAVYLEHCPGLVEAELTGP